MTAAAAYKLLFPFYIFIQIKNTRKNWCTNYPPGSHASPNLLLIQTKQKSVRLENCPMFSSARFETLNGVDGTKQQATSTLFRASTHQEYIGLLWQFIQARL